MTNHLLRLFLLFPRRKNLHLIAYMEYSPRRYTGLTGGLAALKSMYGGVVL